MELQVFRLPGWMRVFYIVVGVITLALGFLVLVDPALGVAALVLLLAFALIIIGIERLITGISGQSIVGRKTQ